MGIPFHQGSASNYPDKGTWKSFDELKELYKPFMVQAGSSPDDAGRICVGIINAAKIGVEERVILSIIMTESTGNVGVGTPADNDHNLTGGLMQCEESRAFPGQKNLSQDDISGMIMAGTKHFKGNLEQRGNGDDAATFYEALRLYNSGRLNPNDLNDDYTGPDDEEAQHQGDPHFHSDPNYVNRVAAYLQGIVG